MFLAQFLHNFISCSKMISVPLSFLPARASEQGNVIGLVSMYIYIYYVTVPRKRAQVVHFFKIELLLLQGRVGF